MITSLEIPNFAAEPNFEVSAIETLNQADATSPGTHGFPNVVQIATKRSDDAETRHYNSTT